MEEEITLEDYQKMAEIRYRMRKFLRFSELASRSAGLEPQHYVTLLAIKGYPGGVRPNVSQLAERMQLEHHTMVEMLDRMAARKMIRRARGNHSRRVVLISLTKQGEDILKSLAIMHKQELQMLGIEAARQIMTLLNVSVSDLFADNTLEDLTNE